MLKIYLKKFHCIYAVENKLYENNNVINGYCENKDVSLLGIPCMDLKSLKKHVVNKHSDKINGLLLSF